MFPKLGDPLKIEYVLRKCGFVCCVRVDTVRTCTVHVYGMCTVGVVEGVSVVEGVVVCVVEGVCVGVGVGVGVSDCLFAGPNLICTQRDQSRTALDLLDDASRSDSDLAKECIAK
mgnify:CR=1 FL=1